MKEKTQVLFLDYSDNTANSLIGNVTRSFQTAAYSAPLNGFAPTAGSGANSYVRYTFTDPQSLPLIIEAETRFGSKESGGALVLEAFDNLNNGYAVVWTGATTIVLRSTLGGVNTTVEENLTPSTTQWPTSEITGRPWKTIRLEIYPNTVRAFSNDREVFLSGGHAQPAPQINWVQWRVVEQTLDANCFALGRITAYRRYSNFTGLV